MLEGGSPIPPPPGSEFWQPERETTDYAALATREKELSVRVKNARWWHRFRKNVHSVIDGTFSTFLTGYQLPHNSRWSLFAEMFWVDCPVCLFWRGVTFGFLLASFLATIVVALFF